MREKKKDKALEIGDFIVTDPRGNAKGRNVQVSATRFKNSTSLFYDGALTLTDAIGAKITHSDDFDQSYIASGLMVTETPVDFIEVPQSQRELLAMES